LAANISLLFTEVPFLERFSSAAETGFPAVEWRHAFDIPKSELATRLADNELQLTLINTPEGDASIGEMGLAALPGREADAAVAFELALDYAITLDAPYIHYLAGKPPPDADPAAIDALFLDNLTRAADIAKKANTALLLEPLNMRHRGGYHLSSIPQAIRLIEEAGRDNIKLLLDLWHAQIIGGDIFFTIEETLDHIGYVQLAGVPDRSEPSNGELAYANVLQHLDTHGYKGFVGAEYIPAKGTREGLGWALPYLQNKR